MHFLTLLSLPLAVAALSINTHAPPPKSKPASKGKGKLPVYNWEHRTICKQRLLNPVEFKNGKDDRAKYEVMLVGYAWEKGLVPTPDHKWNWKTTANAGYQIEQNLAHAGLIVDDLYSMQKGKQDDRGFTQFTLDVSAGNLKAVSGTCC